MSEPTFEDFKDRLSIRTVLEDAGYQFSRRDGVRSPTYVKIGSDGHRVHGDKFIVRRGAYCFKPPEQRCFNVISFIKEHPEKFDDYKAGMDLNRLVNLVCNRLLKNPTVYKQYDIKEDHPAQVFNESAYELFRYDVRNLESKKKFYPYFKDRGFNWETQAAFANYYVIAKNIGREDGKQYTNLAFPFRIPSDENKIVGFEERGRPRQDIPDAKTFKGKASGTNSVDGLWFANLSGKPLAETERVLWFESAYDAMAFYQIHREKGEDTKGVYASTGGSPGERQYRNMIAACPKAVHHLCFDRDYAGQMYACTFSAIKDKREFSSYSMKNGTVVFVDKTGGQYNRHEIPPEDFSYKEVCDKFGLHDSQTVYHPCADGYKDWNDQLLGKRMSVEENRQEKPNEEKPQQVEEDSRSHGFGR